MTTIDTIRPFQTEDLIDLLDNKLNEYDVEGIIKAATSINPRTGTRYWTTVGEELEELVWFHQYEPEGIANNKANDDNDVSARYLYVNPEHSIVSGIVEVVYSYDYAPKYVAEDPRDAAMVVMAAELSILSEEHFHLLLNHSVRSDDAAAHTRHIISKVLGYRGFWYADRD